MAKRKSRDRRRVAVHQAGHAVVAAIEGQRVRVRVYSTRSETEDEKNEKLWGGQVEQIGGTFSPVAAVSGMVAEMVDIELGEPEIAAWEISDLWEAGGDGPSKTDLKYIPADWKKREAAVVESLLILLREKTLFDEIVARLLEDGIVTDEQMADLVKRLRSERAK